MQNRREIEDNVNARHRPILAAERNGGTGRLEELEKERGEPEPSKSWWQRFFKWESLTMSDGTVVQKGFVVSPTLAGIFLVAFLGVLGYGYKANTADNRETREAVIRMETMLNERTRNFERQQDKMEQTLANETKIAEIRRERDTEKNSKLLAALRQKGIIVE